MYRQLKTIVDATYTKHIPQKRNAFISLAKHLYLVEQAHAEVASLTGVSQDQTFENPHYFPFNPIQNKLYEEESREETAWSDEDINEIRNIIQSSNNIAQWASQLLPTKVTVQVEKYIQRWILPLLSLSTPDMPNAQDMVDILDFAQRIIPQGKGYPHKKALTAVAKQFEAITDNKLDWQPPARIKQTDNSIITTEEFQEALAKLDNETDKATTNEKREIFQARKLFLILAFRTGMRRSEILALEKSDFDRHGNAGLLYINHKPHNRLKTQHAVRTLPLKYLIPQREWEIMWKIIDAINAERLFPQRNTDYKIIRPLIRLIRQVSANNAFVVHHLRHSFATWIHVKIRCARNPNMAEQFEFLPKTYTELKEAQQLTGKLISSNTSQSDLFTIAMLMGHSSPLVSIVNYLHGVDLI